MAKKSVPKHAKHARPSNASRVKGFSKQPYAQQQVPVIPKRKKAGKVKIVLIVLACVLALVALLAGVYVYMLQANMSLSSKDSQQLDAVLSDSKFDKPVYTLVLGSDTREGAAVVEDMYKDGSGRSDVMLLIRTDPATKTITMLSIPRDTPVMVDGTKTKINTVYSSKGPEGAVSAVQELTGANISYYAEMHFQDLEKFIDTLGGVTVDVPLEFTMTDILTGEKVTVPAGKQTLDGTQALAFARERKAYGANQDQTRQSNVRQLASSVLKQVLSTPAPQLPGTLLDLSKCVKTNVSVTDMLYLAQAFSGDDVNVYSCTGPAEGAIDEETGLWLCYEDPEGWASVMQKVDSGSNPSA